MATIRLGDRCFPNCILLDDQSNSLIWTNNYFNKNVRYIMVRKNCSQIFSLISWLSGFQSLSITFLQQMLTSFILHHGLKQKNGCIALLITVDIGGTSGKCSTDFHPFEWFKGSIGAHTVTPWVIFISKYFKYYGRSPRLPLPTWLTQLNVFETPKERQAVPIHTKSVFLRPKKILSFTFRSQSIH